MNLTDIRKGAAPRKKKFPAGRGRSSGLGKTCGVGGKGQWGRRGAHMRPYYEGGQMPLIRRVPKRGFNNNVFKERFELVNLDQLQERFEDGAQVDRAALEKAGLVRRDRPVKLVATGRLSRKLVVRVDRATKAAAEAVSKAGGSVELPAKEPTKS